MLKSLAPQTASLSPKIVIRKRHVYRCLLFTVFCILYLCLRHLRSHSAEPVTDALPSPIKPNPFSKNRKIPSLSDAFNEALLESSQNPIARVDFVDTRRYTPNLSNMAKLNVKYLSGSMQKDVTAVDAAEEDYIADTESEVIDDMEQAEDQSLEVSEKEENGEVNDETGEEPEDAEVNDSKEEVQSSSPQSSRTFSVSYKLNHNIDAMADAAGLSKEIMMEMLKARLPSEAFKATGMRSFNSEKWKGDPEYLFKDNLPTCLGKLCSRSEYINVKQNMTTISTSQFMSPYYHAVDISKLTYVPPSTLLTSCRIHLCQNKDCENITQIVIPVPPQEKTRLRRLNHILGHFKNLTSPTHCIREKLKRARFIGNDICNVFNASKADELHYVGIHQCPKARQMIVPLPKASPIIVAPTSIKKRKKGKKNAAQKEVEYVYPTLTVRYIKMDRFRYHQFHNPILIAIREGWVTSQGVVVNKDGAVIHFEGSCQSSDVDPTVFFKNEKLSAVSEVFVASTPSDKASLPYWHFVTTLPRIAPYLEELRAHPHIAIHYTSLGGREVNLVEMHGIVDAILKDIK
ncbi:hypothetical protein HDU79_007127 [Rhizoclosmatium sp. JEL0117]|nr:hypothetical protein HDU79_007127 [Rhizoclosmatium sp. JEL0117]